MGNENTTKSAFIAASSDELKLTGASRDATICEGTDAYIDNSTWCKPGTNTGTPATVAACAPGSVSGVQAAPVTMTAAGLCPAGQAINGFASSIAGNTATYTWGCNGSTVGGLCTASYTAATGGSTIPAVPTLSIVGGATTASIGSIVTVVWRATD